MNQGPQYSDDELLRMLREDARRQMAIAHLYRSAREHVIRLVLKYGGQEDEGLEVLSEGVMVFLKNIDQGKFRHGSQLKVYLVGICKYIWWDRSKKAASAKTISMEEYQEPVLEEAMSEHLDRKETVKVIQHCLHQLKEACRELFRLRYFEGEPAAWEVIAERLGYDNAQVARNKGQRCMKSLKKIYFQTKVRADRNKP